MTSAITAYEHPARFVDEQVRGPFHRWWHEHTFIPQEQKRTLMIDRVEYDPPFGTVGTIVDRVFLDQYLRRLIRTRNVWLKHTLEAES